MKRKAGDIKGHSKCDVLWRTDSDASTTWEMKTGNPGVHWHITGTADFDGDGKTDILWRTDSGVLHVWEMEGDGVTVSSLARASDDSASHSPRYSNTPPAFPEWSLTLFVSRRKLDGLLGDLEERFHRDCAARGPRRAKWLYWAETLRSVAPLLWSAAQKVGVVAVVAAAARRFLG